MDYPGLFLPQLPQPTKVGDAKFHYPISPPHHHNSTSNDSAPSSPPRSAFTAVKSSTSGQTNRQSLELLHNLYANQRATSSFNHHSLYSSPTSTINFPPSPTSSHNSPTRRPSSAAMIEQLMRRRSPTFAAEDTIIVKQHVYGDHEHDRDSLEIRTDDHTKNGDNNGLICVTDSREQMARQRLDLVQRTSVIKSVIGGDDRSLIRSAVQRQSSDSCGASSGSSSSVSSVDEEIVCQWSDCFRLVQFIDTLFDLVHLCRQIKIVLFLISYF